MIAKYTLLGMLGICSVEDIYRQKVHSVVVLLFGIVGVMVHLLQRQISIYSILAGAAIGVLVMLLSRMAKGMVGVGDGLVLMVTGIYLGGTGNMQLLCGGLILTAICGLGLLAFFRRRRTDTIPFVPFLLLSYMGMLWL
ncbi:MAG: hypothetical protein K2O73_03290 [Lachnospiraceae bacterium]|nr:hypothetical protein [Lachnospiraceae bacterium]MDE7435818.1 hypothetical protein [Lachnospiraceae bacterium]